MVPLHEGPEPRVKWELGFAYKYFFTGKMTFGSLRQGIMDRKMAHLGLGFGKKGWEMENIIHPLPQPFQDPLVLHVLQLL